MIQQPTKFSIVARHEVGKFAQGECTLFTAVIISLLLTVASQPIEIPCNTDPSVVYSVQSHRGYTLTGCFPTAVGVAPGVSIAPDATAVVGGVLVLRNVSLTVTGGGALPLLDVSGSSVQMENVTIVLTGVRVGPYVYNRTQQQPRSMVSMLFMLSSVATVRNLSVLLEDCVIDVRSMNFAASLQPSALLQIGTGTMEIISVTFRNSNVSLRVGGPSGNMRGGAVLSIVSTSIRKLEVRFVNSFVILVSHQVLFERDDNPGIIIFLCGSANCLAENITVTSTNTTLMVQEFVPGFAPNATRSIIAVRQTIAVLLVASFFKVENVRLEVLDSMIVVSCVCTSDCETASIAALNAGIAWFTGQFTISGTIQNVTVEATNTKVELAAPSKTTFVATTFFTSSDSVASTLTNCSFTSSNAGQNIGSQLRLSSIVAAYNNILVSNWTIRIQNVSFSSTQESGLCFAAQHAAVYLVGNTAAIDATLTNVTMVTAASNGTAALYSAIPGVVLAMLTTTSALVCLQPAAPTTGGESSRVQITITSCEISAEHTPSLPTRASMFAITSLVCGVSITTSLSDSTVFLDDVHIERRFLSLSELLSLSEPETWFPANAAGFRGNATGMVQFTDITAGVPATLAPYLAIITGGSAAPVRHTNVTVSLQSNCTVGYHSDAIAPLATDRVAFIQFPSVAIQSSYLLHGTLYRSLLLVPGAADVGFGSVAGSTGATQLIDCNVTVRDVVAPMANLITAFNGALQLLSSNMGRTMISFSNVTMVRSIVSPNVPLLLDAYQYVIGAVDGSIVVAPPPIAVDNEFGLIALQSSPVSIQNCSFVGFTLLVEAPALNLSLYNGRSQLEYFLHLGCNSWDSEAMSLPAVSSDAAVLRLVDYRACEDNMEHSASVTKTEAIPVTALSTIHPSLFTDISAATTSGAVAVYAAVLVPVVQARSVAGLQRAIAALRLAARCAASTANATYADPMFSQLVDNPLGLPVAVGADALRFAAGAAVGNALLVLAIATLMHCLQLAKSRAAGTKVIAVLTYLPSSLLPGSAAMPFGKLAQPAVGACVALTVSGDRSVRSVVCGAAMLVIWAAYPAYCCAVVLVRGRRAGVFVLRSEGAQRTKPAAMSSLSEVVDFATEPTHEWAAARGDGKYAGVLLRRMLPVFEAYVDRREWYFAVEWGFAIVSGAVLGTAEAVASGGDACLAAQWGVGSAVGLSVVQLLVCLWLRPFAVRLELWMALLLGGLELVSNSLSLTDKTAAADVVVSVSAYLELVIGVLVPLVACAMNMKRFTVDGRSFDSAYHRGVGSYNSNQYRGRYLNDFTSTERGPGCIGSAGAHRRSRKQDAQLQALIEIICRDVQR